METKAAAFVPSLCAKPINVLFQIGGERVGGWDRGHAREGRNFNYFSTDFKKKTLHIVTQNINGSLLLIEVPW